MFCPLNLPDNHASGIVGKKYKPQSPVFGEKELMNKPPKVKKIKKEPLNKPPKVAKVKRSR